MKSNFNTWAFAALTLAVVVLLVGAIGASVTGHGIFDWLREDGGQEQIQIEEGETYIGLLAEKYLEAGMSKEDLKYYRVVYDEEGDLVFEDLNGETTFGDSYEYIISDSGEESLVKSASITGPYTVHTECYCRTDGSGGTCIQKCKKTMVNGEPYCSGTCSGISCREEACRKSTTISYD